MNDDPGDLLAFAAGERPAEPGVLLPGQAGDVALRKVRRQIEVPRASLDAPRLAMAGVVDVARATRVGLLGSTTGGEHLAIAVRDGLSEAQQSLDRALAALDQLEKAVVQP
jgi:hypothetical protein